MPKALKFFKYEAISFAKEMSFFYILTILCCALARLTPNLAINGNVAVAFIRGFTETFLPPAIICSTIFNGAIRLWIRYGRKVYGQEAYLTHTLPLKGRQIHLSYAALAFASTVTTALVCLGGLTLAYAGTGTLDHLIGSISEIATMLDISTPLLITAAGVLLWLEYLAITLIGIAATSLGHRFNNRKKLASVLIGLAIYVALQVLILGIAYLMALGNDQIMSIFQDAPINDFNRLDTLIYLMIAYYALVDLLINIPVARILDKGINIE